MVSKLRFVEDLNAYNLIHEELLEEYLALDEQFEKGDSQSIVLLENENDWNGLEALRNLLSITQLITNSKEEIYATSITNIKLLEKSGLSLAQQPILKLDTEDNYLKWKKNKTLYADVHSKFLSENGKYALIYCSEKVIPKNLKVALTSIKGHYGVSAFYFYDSSTYNSELQSSAGFNLALTIIISLVLIMVSFFLLTGSFKGLLLILVMTCFNLSLVVVVMYLLDIGIGPHISAVPSLIAVMSFSDIMHILYQHKVLSNHTQRDLGINLKIKKKLNRPMLWTSLTNIIGFVVYIIVAVNAYISDLGIVALSGVGIAYLSARFLVIDLITPNKSYINDRTLNKIEQGYYRIYECLLPIRIQLLFGLVLITFGLFFFVYSFSRAGSESRVFISDNSNIARAQATLETQFFGNQSIDVIVQNDSEYTLLDSACLGELTYVENKVKSILNPLYVSGPLNVIKRYNRFRIGGHPHAFKIPNNFTYSMKKEFYKVSELFGWNEVVSKNERKARFSFGFLNHSSEERAIFYREINSAILNLSNYGFHFRLTGRSKLQDSGESGFVKLVFMGFIIAFILAGIIAGFTFKSLRRALAFLIVNALPLLVALSLMILMDIPVSTISIFMLAILVGLCLDDSIYIITTPKSKENSEGIYPIIVTTVVLAFGMLALSFSIYEWIRPFGLIFFASFFVSLLADIFILPLLLTPTKKQNIND